MAKDPAERALEKAYSDAVDALRATPRGSEAAARASRRVTEALRELREYRRGKRK